MKKHLTTAILYTAITAVILGVAYPLAITALAHAFFPKQAAGSLVYNSQHDLIGSQLIGQPFTGPTYFHSRPSAAGNGYDATSSSPSNYAASNQKLISRIDGDVARYAAENKSQPVPIDLVTASGSGLDPDISPAAAMFQAATVANARHLPLETVRDLVQRHIQGRQFGFLGEERVNVLLLNMDLDRLAH